MSADMLNDGPGEEDGPWAEGWEQRTSTPPRALTPNVQRYKVQQDKGIYALKGCDDGDLVDWSAYEALLRRTTLNCVWRSGCSDPEQCRLERRCTRSNPEDRERDLIQAADKHTPEPPNDVLRNLYGIAQDMHSHLSGLTSVSATLRWLPAIEAAADALGIRCGAADCCPVTKPAEPPGFPPDRKKLLGQVMDAIRFGLGSGSPKLEADLRSALAAPPAATHCEWSEIESGSGIYNTCKAGEEFHLSEGMEMWPYCHLCGREIEVARPPETKEGILNRAADDIQAALQVSDAFKQPELVIDAMAAAGVTTDETIPPDSLAKQIEQAKRTVEQWPADVKRAMGIADETSACRHLRRVGQATPEGKVIREQCEDCGAELNWS